MRPSSILAALAFCIGSITAASAQEELEPLEEELPQVTVVKRGDETVTEFRLRGKLYMVKVTQPNGMTYYLVDRDGSGQWVRDDNGHRLVVPSWVLTSW